jgi:ATP synthase F1 complex assembly factor 2
MERATYATKSFLISLALVKVGITVDQASDASRVEVLSQIKRWGEVEDCQSFDCLSLPFLIASLAHDVDYQEIRQSLGSAASLLVNTSRS